MAVHGHMSSDLKRLMVHNVKLPPADRALSRQLVYVFVGRVLRGQHFERAGASAGAVMWRCLFKEHEPDTAGRDASLFLQILSHCVTDDTRGSLDSLDLLIQMYATSRSSSCRHAGRLNTYMLVQEEVRNILVWHPLHRR